MHDSMLGLRVDLLGYKQRHKRWSHIVKGSSIKFSRQMEECGVCNATRRKEDCQVAHPELMVRASQNSALERQMNVPDQGT